MAGTPALAAQRAVAIVGTRTASSTGKRFAAALAQACAANGIGVVSGLARGIDAAAHERALEANGTTIAVLGTGLDIVYPARHRALQEQIAQLGLLITEVPPGSRGHGGTFPLRNRMIAALAEVTVVVEAGKESGALITARVANDLGRTVCAVPGSVAAPECAGTNALIRDGAQVLLSPDDLLQELGCTPAHTAAPALDGDEAAVWHALSFGTASIETLAQRATLDVRRTSVALAALELHALVDVDPSGMVRPLVT
jgi:DNA processing protein